MKTHHKQRVENKWLQFQSAARYEQERLKFNLECDRKRKQGLIPDLKELQVVENTKWMLLLQV